MKQKLLYAALLLGSSLTASAQWTYPEPEITNFKVVEGTFSTDTVYLYNVNAKTYFTEGYSQWKTQAGIGDTGLKVYFNQYIPTDLVGTDSIWDGSSYQIYDFSLVKNAWHRLFTDSEEAMFVDRGTQGNDCWLYSIEENLGAFTFRITAAPTSKWHESVLGYKGYLGFIEGTDGKLVDVMKPLLVPEELDPSAANAYHVDWAFVTKEAYAKQQESMVTYLAAKSLKAKIEEIEALAPSIDLTAEKAVYDNTNSTVEELNAAKASVAEKYKAFISGVASPTNPMSMNDLFSTTNFDDNFDGWSSTTGCQNNLLATNQCGVTGPDGNFHFNGKFWENWNSGAYTGKMYTEVGPAPAGVYRLEMAAFANGGSGAYIYMNNDSVEVLSADKPFTYSVMSIINTDSIEIGLKEVAKRTNWMGIDNVNLLYYGCSAESFEFLMTEKIAQYVIPEEAYYATDAKDAYDAVASAVGKPESLDDAVAKLQQLNDAWATFKANMDAYEALQKALEEANASIEEGFDAYEPLNDYVMDVEDVLQGGTATTEEALAKANELREMITIARKMLKVGDRVLVFENMNFDKKAEGWLIDTQSVSGAISDPLAPGGHSSNPNGEKWNANFDYYQVAEGLPNAVYKLQAQAFYRTQGNSASEANRETDEILAWIYINDTKQPVKNIMSAYRTEEELMNAIGENVISNCYQRTDDPAGDGSVVYTPNGMTSASAFFTLGDYENEVYGIVTDGKLRIGVKSEGTLGDRWTMFDNFRVTYMGMDEDILGEILAAKVAEAEALAASQMAVATKEALNNEISAANSALSASGNQMFDAIQSIEGVITTAKASVKNYENLAAAYDKLLVALEDASVEGTGSSEAFDAADVMINAIEAVLETGEWSDEEVAAKIAETESIIAELKKPAEEASDSNPVDYTRYITNPTFDTIGDFTGWGDNGSSGWAAGGTTGPNAERYQGQFNTFQKIKVPAGVYQLSVNGYFRSGWADKDWTDYQAQQEALATDPNYVDPTLTAFLYALTSEGQYSVALPHLAAGYVEGGFGLGDQEVKVGSNYYVANTMNAADTYFHTPKIDEQGNEYYPYFTSVILKVGADQELTIGVRRDAPATQPEGNWCIVDDFQLICFGTESAKELSGDAVGIDEVAASDAVSVEYFTIGGAKVKAAQKGINIKKQVNKDGTVTVSKVLVK